LISLETARGLYKYGYPTTLRLDQLLGEMEERGYWWEINHRLVDGGIKKYKTWIAKKHSNDKEQIFTADTPEEAASRALLWILERK
jgi:hypothetical protein